MLIYYAAICLGAGIVLGIACLLLARSSRARNTQAPQGKTMRTGNAFCTYASTIIGSRSSQQDSYMIPDETVGAYTLQVAGELMLLCDGMGGMQGGEMASRLCAETLFHGYYAGRYIKDPRTYFRAALMQADRKISLLTDADGRSLKSGTTCVAALVRGDKLYWASVGDSRIYVYSASGLRQITRDHNYSLTLSQRVAAGELTSAQAAADPQRDALISYVGKGKIELLDAGTEKLNRSHGDVVILCSDGLYRALSEDEIVAVLQENRTNPAYVPIALTNASSSKTWMKHDNTTVIVAL